jgi:hypothetical protein
VAGASHFFTEWATREQDDDVGPSVNVDPHDIEAFNARASAEAVRDGACPILTISDHARLPIE